MFRRSYTIFAALAISSLVGCTDPGETTGIGAAAGGALGAGLGAIIGSQTGDPGGGLVMGATAGAAGGGLIGNSLQAQQEAIQSQDEAIERQEQTIAAQKAAIDDLRRSIDDPTPSDYNRTRQSNSRAPSNKPTTVAEKDLTVKSDTYGRYRYDWKQPEGAVESAECKEAGKEGAAAASAKESADKLFHLRRALRLCPNSAKHHYELGKVYQALKRKDDASYEYHEALKADPAFHPASEALRNVK